MKELFEVLLGPLSTVADKVFWFFLVSVFLAGIMKDKITDKLAQVGGILFFLSLGLLVSLGTQGNLPTNPIAFIVLMIMLFGGFGGSVFCFLVGLENQSAKKEQEEKDKVKKDKEEQEFKLKQQESFDKIQKVEDDVQKLSEGLSEILTLVKEMKNDNKTVKKDVIDKLSSCEKKIENITNQLQYKDKKG